VVEGQVLTHSRELRQGALSLEVIRDVDRFNAIGSDWDRLVAESGVDPLFLSHAWFRTWWESFGEGNELHVVTIWSGGRLVAAAPMMRSRTDIYGFKVRTLHAIYNPHTPRFDFIIGNNEDPRLYEAIWNELIAENGCEAIILAQIPEGSLTTAILEKLAKRNDWMTGQWKAPASPFIKLGCDYETFFNTLGSGCRFNLTKRYARLTKNGPVDVEVVTEARAVDDAMRDGLRIEAAAWKGEKGTAMLSDPAVAEFYTKLARRQADLGQLRLTFLRVAGKRIAFNYLLQSRRKLYAVKIGYDPQYHAFSPGNMLLNLIIKDACECGIEEYDLLGGDDSWKFQWTSHKREHRWLFLFRNRLKSRALHCLKFGIVPALKRYVL